MYRIVLLYLLLVLLSVPRYIYWLPTLRVYPFNRCEDKRVESRMLKRTKYDYDLFQYTDKSVSSIFSQVVPHTISELDAMIQQPHVVYMILFFKYTINRARPYQINPKIRPLYSSTANTPAFPAGHAFQAYYLAYVLGRKYPKLQTKLDAIARRCDDVRVAAGLHYPSDGAFAYSIVNIFKRLSELLNFSSGFNEYLL